MKKFKDDLKFYAVLGAGALGLWLTLAVYFLANPPRAWIALGLVPLLILAAGAFVWLNATRKAPLYSLCTILALAAVEYSVVFLPPQFFAEVIECTIVGDDNTAQGGERSTRSQKFIYTDHADNEPFQNVDAIAFLKTNSLNVQGKAKQYAGQRVRMKVYGIRFSLLSITRNVIWIEPLE